MSRPQTSILELAAWGLDLYAYRPAEPSAEAIAKGRELLAQRPDFEAKSALMASMAAELREGFAAYARRDDLLAEMSGLTWSMGLIDLRNLVAFQRRLSFRPGLGYAPIPVAGDWRSLLELSFAPPKAVVCESFVERTSGDLILRSDNPDLHLRATKNRAHPIAVHAGGPFFEVARFRDRWFLRDGYHRAYTLLRAEVFEVPAVIVEAATLEEVGADQPWFFPEDVLFSAKPPTVMDFLSEELVVRYERPHLTKTLRIKIEETFEAEASTGEDR